MTFFHFFSYIVSIVVYQYIIIIIILCKCVNHQLGALKNNHIFPPLNITLSLHKEIVCIHLANDYNL